MIFDFADIDFTSPEMEAFGTKIGAEFKLTIYLPLELLVFVPLSTKTT